MAINARDQAGRHFNGEMQMLARHYYEKRILYYWAKLHQPQLHGRAEGEMIGRIHLCERLLKRPLTPTEPLVNRRYHLAARGCPRRTGCVH